MLRSKTLNFRPRKNAATTPLNPHLPLYFGKLAKIASMIRCPICEKQFDPATSEAMPFCSRRCQQIDLGRWLREVYSVPVERNPDDEEPPEHPEKPE